MSIQCTVDMMTDKIKNTDEDHANLINKRKMKMKKKFCYIILNF